jgi:hypothetical protein
MRAADGNRTRDPEIGKVVRGALVPSTWRIRWVQDAHCAHQRAWCSGDLHQECIRAALCSSVSGR